MQVASVCGAVSYPCRQEGKREGALRKGLPESSDSRRPKKAYVDSCKLEVLKICGASSGTFECPLRSHGLEAWYPPL